MARLVYGIIAAALVALVAGFFTSSSAVPLVISITLSLAATVIITVGWARRIRLEDELVEGGTAPELEEITVDVGEDEFAATGELPVHGPLHRRARSKEDGSPRGRPKIPGRRTERPAPEGSPKRQPSRRSEAKPSSRKPKPEATERRAGVPGRKPSRKRAKPAPRDRGRRGPKGGATKPARARKAAERPPAKRRGRVVVIPGRDRYHAQGCRFVTGEATEETTEAAARRRGLVPCSVCLRGG